MKRALVWLRNDLRIHDNETVTKAIEENDQVLFLYIKQPEQIHPQCSDIAVPYQYRNVFIDECLIDLNEQLQGRKAKLTVAEGEPISIISDLIEHLRIERVYISAEYADYELLQEYALEQIIPLHRYHTSTLIHPAQLPFGIAELPDVFTNFRHKAEKLFRLLSFSSVPDQISCIAVQEGLQTINHQSVPDAIKPIATLSPIHFKGGRAAALHRLHYYFFESKCIRRYKETRNGMLGMDYSSKFSPWLAQGCISAREAYAQLLRHESLYGENESTYWLIFELLWRDYFRYVFMKHNKRLFHVSGIRNIKRNYCGNKELFKKWCFGQTGVDFVDALMRELLHTGFMSNRGRQNAASYLVHDLQINWMWGAALFEHLLIDYDVYSNYGNWQYVAGVGNDPREGRKFNIKRQQETYDPDNLYINYWLRF